MPRLLLLDEPAAGMNPTETRELMGDIGRIRDRGVTILLIEHDMKLVRGICDRVVALDRRRQDSRGGFRDRAQPPCRARGSLGRLAPRMLRLSAVDTFYGPISALKGVGIALGTVYGLLALGYTMVYGVLFMIYFWRMARSS